MRARQKMNKKALILGHALAQGLTKIKLQKLSGMSPATFDRRMANPDDITIGELRQMDGLIHFDDEVLVNLIRKT